MKILFLGDPDCPLVTYLQYSGEKVVSTADKINMGFINVHRPEFLISYGYRHIISADILEHYLNTAINLHISFLPWNRGADPNFWSFVENTPKGVTIHYLDEGIDTGDIIVQKEVKFSDHDTLRTTYLKLHEEIQILFKTYWINIILGECARIPQTFSCPIPPSHKSIDKEKLAFLLTDGWDTPVRILEEYAAETQLSSQFWRDSL